MPQRSRYLGRGQLAVCMRSGIKCHASELVRDGRIPSLLVLPEWADPPQPQEQPYVPNDLEGAPRFPVSPDVTPLTPPVLTATAEDDVSVLLMWTPAEWIAGPRTDSYRLMRSEDGAGFLLIETIEVEYDAFGGITGPALAFSDTDVIPGESYRYKVVGVASGRTATSNIETVTPVEPVETFRLLQEDGGLILTEDDDVLIWETV